jgi:3-deoxy-manno-octulosonate cytidylyltransferase (CMP-KDO synthetase)
MEVTLRERFKNDKFGNMAKVLGIIPARFDSTRIPQKMLKEIHGKTLIQRTFERTKGAKSLDALIIATDSPHIADVAKNLNAPVVMTSVHHKTGTDRAAEAVTLFSDFTPDIVVVVWGDEPLYPASVIDMCVEKLLSDSELSAVVAADRVVDETMLGADSVVKIVTDKYDRALYISRALIPHHFKEERPDYYHVIGAMAMRTDFLSKYVSMEQTPHEIRESVEQLRILENGHRLGVVRGDFKNLGVNTPRELEEVIRIFGERIQNGELE